MLRVEAFAAHSRGASTAGLLKDLREDAAALIQDPKREIKSFRLAYAVPLGTKRGRGRGAAIDSVLGAVDAFYGEVLQHLKAWSATPPKMREGADIPPATPPALVSTALSSQDGIEPAEPAADPEPPAVAAADEEVPAAVAAEEEVLAVQAADDGADDDPSARRTPSKGDAAGRP